MPAPAPIVRQSGAVVEIEVQRIFVAYRHAFPKGSPPLKPRDRAAAAQAAELGTCHAFGNDELAEEFARTAQGLLGAGYEASLTAVLNHVGEKWGEARGRSYPMVGGDDVKARIAELAEIAGMTVDEFRAQHGGAPCS